jgi:hypothetical protein
VRVHLACAAPHSVVVLASGCEVLPTEGSTVNNVKASAPTAFIISTSATLRTRCQRPQKRPPPRQLGAFPALTLPWWLWNQSSRHVPRNCPIIPIRRPEPIDDPAWAAELKLDGFRGLADATNARMLSKNLNPLKRFQHLLDGLPKGCVFDGEICALDEDGRSDFNALLFERRQPSYIVFDLLFYERKDIRSLPLKERRAILDQVAKRYGLQKSELFFCCGKTLLQAVYFHDLEGIIAKRLDDPYDSARTKWWKVLNRDYSQKQNRHELFQARVG